MVCSACQTSFGVLVLTEVGVRALLPYIGGKGNCIIAPTWPKPVESMNFESVFSLKPVKPISFPEWGKEFRQIETQGDTDFEEVLGLENEPSLKDLGVMGHGAQLRYVESRAFRALCFNNPTLWAEIAGTSCLLESSLTIRAVRRSVPVGLRELQLG